MIVSNVTHNSQTRLGNLTPKADQRKFASSFAVVSGNCPPGWNTVNDHKHGIAFGENGEHRMQSQEFKDANGTNDVDYHGLKLREVVHARADAEKKDAIEAGISNARTRTVLLGRSENPSQGVSIVAEPVKQETFVQEAPAENLYETQDKTPEAPKKEHWRARDRRLAAEAAAQAA